MFDWTDYQGLIATWTLAVIVWASVHVWLQCCWRKQSRQGNGSNH